MTDEQYVDRLVVELLVSRVVHDLVSPIGAIVNGIELMTEFSAGLGDDASGLVRLSADVASARLRFYRVAYGFAGGTSRYRLTEVRSLLDDMLRSGKGNLDWPLAEEETQFTLPRGAVKMVLNTALLAAEALRRGGSLAIRLTRYPGCIDGTLTAAGDGAKLGARTLSALQDGVLGNRVPSDLDPRTVHGFFAGRIAWFLGATIKVEQTTDRVAMRFSAPMLSETGVSETGGAETGGAEMAGSESLENMPGSSDPSNEMD